MDFLELVKKRSSIRKYSEQQVNEEDLNKCLEAARLSPSACNSQPWQFIIVDKQPLREKLCRAMLSGVYGMNNFAAKAPVLIVVVADSANWLIKVCNVFRDTRMYLVDIGLACENFCLEAAELGLGTCILGWFNERAVRKVLSIRRGKRIPLIISLGYPASDYAPVDKIRKPLSEMSRYAE